MILYFSATGNCKYVAGRIARAIGQDAVSIVDCIREGRYSFSDESIGIIAPTYFWGLPSIVKEFLEKTSFRTDYLYYIATYGTTPGASDYMAKRAIRGCEISAFYSIRMADTWTPVFDLSTPEKVARFTKTTEAEIGRAINCIAARRTNRHMRPRVPAIIVQWIANRSTIEKCGAHRICMWMTAASAAACARENARCTPSKCRTGDRFGCWKNAPCASAACTAAPSLRFSTAETPENTGNTRTRT